MRSVSRFCDDIETSFNKTSSSAKGVASQYDAKTAFTNYMGALGYFMNTTIGIILRDTVNDNATLDQTMNAPGPSIAYPVEILSWDRQVATEIGPLIHISPMRMHSDCISQDSSK
jgi:hypothetical protein